MIQIKELWLGLIRNEWLWLIRTKLGLGMGTHPSSMGSSLVVGFGVLIPTLLIYFTIFQNNNCQKL